MRDCGGYGGDVRDFVGDAGIVRGADAVERAEGFGGVGKWERKDNAETLSTRRFAERKRGRGSRRERR